MTILVNDHMWLSVVPPSDRASEAYVRIAGDVDVRSAHSLGLAASELVDGTATAIYVDVDGVQFMGSALVEFLMQLGDEPTTRRRPLVVCRPGPMVRRVLHFTGLDELVTVQTDLPPTWPDEAGVSAAAPQP